MTANLFVKDPEHRLICSMANADTKAILNHILCTKLQNVNLDSIWLPCVIIFSDHVSITSLCLFCTWSGSDVNRSSPTKKNLTHWSADTQYLKFADDISEQFFESFIYICWFEFHWNFSEGFNLQKFRIVADSHRSWRRPVAPFTNMD